MPSVTSTGISTDPTRRAHPGRSPSTQAEPRRRRRGGPGACSAACPSPASRRCASTSCSSAGRADRRARSSPLARRSSDGAQPGSTSATIASGASSIRPVGVRSTSGERGAAAGRGRCRAGSPRAPPASRPSASAPKPSPYGPVRSMRSSMRSGPVGRRRRASSISSPASRPFDVPPSRVDRLLHLAEQHEVVERRRGVRARALPAGDRARAAAGSPTPAARPARARPPAASSSRRCGSRAEKREVVVAFVSSAGGGRITSACRVVSLR